MKFSRNLSVILHKLTPLTSLYPGSLPEDHEDSNQLPRLVEKLQTMGGNFQKLRKLSLRIQHIAYGFRLSSIFTNFTQLSSLDLNVYSNDNGFDFNDFRQLSRLTHLGLEVPNL